MVVSLVFVVPRLPSHEFCDVADQVDVSSWKPRPGMPTPSPYGSPDGMYVADMPSLALGGGGGGIAICWPLTILVYG